MSSVNINIITIKVFFRKILVFLILLSVILLFNPIVRRNLYSFFKKGYIDSYNRHINTIWEDYFYNYSYDCLYADCLTVYKNSNKRIVQPMNEAHLKVAIKWEKEGIISIITDDFCSKHKILNKENFPMELESAISIFLSTRGYDFFPEEKQLSELKIDIHTLLYGGNILNMTKFRFCRALAVIEEGMENLLNIKYNYIPDFLDKTIIIRLITDSANEWVYNNYGR